MGSGQRNWRQVLKMNYTIDAFLNYRFPEFLRLLIYRPHNSKLLEEVYSFIILHAMQTTNWREKFAGIFTLIIGLFFLGLLIFDFISSRASSVSSTDGNIVISRSALFMYLRVCAGVLLSLIGAFALLKVWRIGWVFCITVLLLHIVITGYLTWFLFSLGMKAEMGAVSFSFLLGLISVIFLVLPGTRQKYRVSSKTILLTLVFLLAISALFFFLQ